MDGATNLGASVLAIPPFFPQAMLGGFSFRAGEHTTSAVRKIAGPNQNDYNFRKNRIGNVPEKRARAQGFPWGLGPRVPLGPGSKGEYVLSVGKTRW